ncbi:DUF3997 domain-containing protein [Foetidibacter luteolus]|uniref:DUF3997 domain-containing protein n=1 Tax=Foetidibacter luteolus TaxID=2608880 RepID=UPI001A99D320|nr:DUF3997 domain-containing protein [Foetidibacter luteolus]
MKASTSVIPFAIVLSVISFCACVSNSGSTIITGGYKATWTKAIITRSIYKNESLVPAYVFAVGHNNKFIFAKQHPVAEYASKPDTSVTNYYLIEITDGEFQNKPVHGPLTKGAFDSLCSNLKVTEVLFNMQYDENP